MNGFLILNKGLGRWEFKKKKEETKHAMAQGCRIRKKEQIRKSRVEMGQYGEMQNTFQGC